MSADSGTAGKFNRAGYNPPHFFSPSPMNIFYEEDGSFKVGSILADNTTSLQVETLHGKRSKIKAANVMLRFAQPGLAEFMAQAEQIADGMDLDLLWEAAPADEFDCTLLAAEYFGHPPTPVETAGALIRLHNSPMHFYKKGKGRYKAAPAEALQAALASAEKKRLQAAQQARYLEQLTTFQLPDEFCDKLAMLLYRPDRNSIEVKALEAACAATHLSAPHLLQRCGAIPSSHDYHLQKFLTEHFAQGVGFPAVQVDAPPELPHAAVSAFSIDDAATTEIDDAFSVERLTDGRWRIGIHIAAPALGIAPDTPLDAIARQRLSTVYMPGDKITMLPDELVQAYTLNAQRVCPALSLYVTLDADTLEIVGQESRIERLLVAANLRHDTLEPLFNEETLAAGKLDYPWASELKLLWELAQKLEAARGKPSDNSTQQVDYTFHVENDVVTIGIRRRGSPIDKVVSELMILANNTWGKLLDEQGVPGLYRTQNNGKVKMSTVAAPHQGLGVSHYAWCSSPLRRYVDLVNQRQIISVLRGEPPVYARNDARLYAILRDFDAAYTAYAEFQRDMERYWCLRWLLQEAAKLPPVADKPLHGLTLPATVIRENLVRFDTLPLVGRIPALPEQPANTPVQLVIESVDLLDLTFQAHPVAATTVQHETSATA